jgi:hypothetical protein
MKPYTVKITNDLPRDRLVELFENRDNLYAWQNGLESFEHVCGESGQPGARSKLVYLSVKDRVELMETITKRDLPVEYSASYESDIGNLVGIISDARPRALLWRGPGEPHHKRHRTGDRT